jgi:nucleoside-diphosphate-sugar epimerase
MLDGVRPKTTLGTQRWDYLFIDDVADGILAAATATQAEGVFNLGSGEAVPVRAIVEQLRDIAAAEMELVFGEIPFRQDQVFHMEADISRLREATGWWPRIDLASGLRETVDWHKLQMSSMRRSA